MKNTALVTVIALSFFANLAPAKAKQISSKLLAKPSLSFELAHTMAMACIDRQRRSQSSPVYVSIYDEGANPILLLKMDGAALGAGISAMNKAQSSARFPYSTNEVSQWVKDNASVAHIPGLLGVQGGLPIFSQSGVHLGGIGVSGAVSKEDESCAQVAIDAVQPRLIN